MEIHCHAYRTCTCIVPVVGPGAELNWTRLVIEGEVSNIDIACSRKHSAWFPVHVTIVP
jgi:hypothetical protein